MWRTFLVVDDDALVRRALVRLLRVHAPIVDVDSAEEALELVSAGQRFAAILCDVKMRGLSGIDLFLRLLTLAPVQADRFFAVTGSHADELDAGFRHAIGGRLLTKPFDSDRLVTMVAQRQRCD